MCSCVMRPSRLDVHRDFRGAVRDSGSAPVPVMLLKRVNISWFVPVDVWSGSILGSRVPAIDGVLRSGAPVLSAKRAYAPRGIMSTGLGGIASCSQLLLVFDAAREAVIPVAGDKSGK